jgi:aspartate beta-hydroxylase
MASILHLTVCRKLQDNWQKIREEGVAVLANKLFKDEAENLRDVGNWQQFELYARGGLQINTWR